jgi:hypothetical protein
MGNIIKENAAKTNASKKKVPLKGGFDKGEGNPGTAGTAETAGTAPGSAMPKASMKMVLNTYFPLAEKEHTYKNT